MNLKQINQLSPEESKLMDALVSHIVNLYFDNPNKFVKPVMNKKLYNGIDEKKKRINNGKGK